MKLGKTPGLLVSHPEGVANDNHCRYKLVLNVENNAHNDLDVE